MKLQQSLIMFYHKGVETTFCKGWYCYDLQEKIYHIFHIRLVLITHIKPGVVRKVVKPVSMIIRLTWHFFEQVKSL